MAKIIRFRKGRPGDPPPDRPLFPADAIGDLAPRKPPFYRPTDARPAPARHSDAQRDEGRRDPGAPPDPEVERRRTLHRRIWLSSIAACFTAGLLFALFAEDGWLGVREARAELRALETDLADHQARVRALRDEVETLAKDPRALERIAREQLGYARPGEFVLLLPGDDAEALEGDRGSATVAPVRAKP